MGAKKKDSDRSSSNNRRKPKEGENLHLGKYERDSSELDRAKAALSMMKELEKKFQPRMKQVTIDSRTILCGTRGAIEYKLAKIKKNYKDNESEGMRSALATPEKK